MMTLRLLRAPVLLSLVIAVGCGGLADQDGDDGGTDDSNSGSNVDHEGGTTDGDEAPTGGNGTGGSDSGLGGTDAGTGGAESGTGGSEPGTGGSDAGTGGGTSTGGTDAGTGGTDSGTGGTDSGTGGGSSGGSSTVLCLTVDEHQFLELTCPEGQVIDAITFASYGMPEGSCSEDDLSIGWCDAQTSLELVEDACLGFASCSMAAENEVFDDPCVGTFKHLSVQVVCVGP